MSPRRTTLAATILLLTITPALAQNVPNPFLAPVQAPPPLQGTPPNGTPPIPEPIAEPTPTVFMPYALSPVVVEPQHQELNLAPVNTFAFEPTPLLPPAPTQVHAQAEASTPELPESLPQTEAPTNDDTPTTPAATASNEPTDEQGPAEEQTEHEAPEVTPPATAANAPTAAPVAPAPQSPNEVLILGITTGVKPTVMIRVGGTLGIYNIGDELPNGLTIDTIEPLAVTFLLPEEKEHAEEAEEDAEQEPNLEGANGNEEEKPATLRVHIQ